MSHDPIGSSAHASHRSAKHLPTLRQEEEAHCDDLSSDPWYSNEAASTTTQPPKTGDDVFLLLKLAGSKRVGLVGEQLGSELPENSHRAV